jgi:3-dehydro-L-gulonate 2-dehydrogenase
MLRLSFDLIVSELMRVLTALGFSEARARQSATLFAETQLDGIASHGLNRFPRFVRQVRAGVVSVGAEPTRVDAGHGTFSRIRNRGVEAAAAVVSRADAFWSGARFRCGAGATVGGGTLALVGSAAS